MAAVPKPPAGARPTVSQATGASGSTRSRSRPASRTQLTQSDITPAHAPTRHKEPNVSKTAIESGAERVFMTHPRMFSFSHRCLQSLRHPFLPVAVLQVELDLSKVKRHQWQTRAERLGEVMTDGTSAMRYEEARWAIIGRMLDGVLCRDYIADRRQAALENNVSLRRSLENWWCKLGGTTTSGVSEQAYKQAHKAMYGNILQSSESALDHVITKAIESDWQQDSQGAGEVPFGRWYISLLEIADTWVAKCDGEAYGLFLDSLLKSVFPPPGSAPVVPHSPGLKAGQPRSPMVLSPNKQQGGVLPSATPHAERSGVGMTPIPIIKTGADDFDPHQSAAIKQPQLSLAGEDRLTSDPPSFLMDQQQAAVADAATEREQELWAGVINSLRETAATMENPPIIRAKRNVRGIIEYEKAVFQKPKHQTAGHILQ